MPRTISYTETLEVTQCYCGINLAVPDNLLRNARENGTNIYCPLGHVFGWTETKADKLAKQLEREQRLSASRLAELDQEKASHSSTKGQLTKARKRAANGVCQCCHRSFVDVARHMKSKHPDFPSE